MCENNLSYVAKPACDSWLVPKVLESFENAPNECDFEWRNGHNNESNNHLLFCSILWTVCLKWLRKLCTPEVAYSNGDINMGFHKRISGYVTIGRRNCAICMLCIVQQKTIFVVPCIMLNSEMIPTRCNNCVYSSQWLYSTCFGWHFYPSSGVQCCIWPYLQYTCLPERPYTALYSWWWVELSSETCRVKPLRRINAIVASCWNHFTIFHRKVREAFPKLTVA